MLIYHPGTGTLVQADESYLIDPRLVDEDTGEAVRHAEEFGVAIASLIAEHKELIRFVENIATLVTVDEAIEEAVDESDGDEEDVAIEAEQEYKQGLSDEHSELIMEARRLLRGDDA